jgi:cytochrome c553
MTWRHLAAAAALLSLGLMAGSPACAQARKAAPRVSAASAAGTSATAGAAVYAERFRTVCAACHGANGRSDMPGTPVLAGQHSLYAITQLFLFREGRRNNEAMVALAKQMKDADLRGFSDYIGTLPPVPAPAPAAPPDAARMNQGQALAKEHKCVFCHGADLAGGQGVPRIGGQKEDYVRATLQGFKSGARPGYTRAMTEALSQVPEQDLPLLAYFVANFTGK